MFRAANNPFDDAVVQATDENLTSENWALILDVCDRVAASPQGPSSVIAALIKRLAHRNANVQLYTLELANSLSQNCGPPLHRELASRSFTDALLRLANDRNTHQMVKAKVMERMNEWTDMFGKDPDLGIMEQAFEKLRVGNPGLAPPSKPVKKGMSPEDKRKEDEELQMALALSLKDKGSDAPASAPASATSPTARLGSVGTDAAVPGATQQQQQQQPGTTAATVSRVKALYDFTPSEPGELAFRTGDIIAVLESVYKDWWKGSLRGQTGIFPLNYVEKLQDPTPQELERDAAMEGDVFSQIRNVEKLLSLLSVRQDGMGRASRDAGTEDEITELYNQTLAIRPKLIELIGKYSQKKDDFTQLNERFIKARRDYEALLESSMSAPPMQYGMNRQRQPSQPYYANAYGPPQGYSPQQQQPPPLQQQPSQPYPSQAPPPSQDARYAYSSPPPESQQPPPQAAYPYNPPATSTPAPFHILANGAPPTQDQPPNTAQGNNPDQPYSPQLQQRQQFPPQAGRPGSIHTLNSGNPQELGVGAYESPTSATNQQQSPYDAVPPGPLYSAQQPPSSMHGAPAQQPLSGIIPAGTYPSLPGGGGGGGSGGYQAYNPQAARGGVPPAAAAAPAVGGAKDADDASDFYR